MPDDDLLPRRSRIAPAVWKHFLELVHAKGLRPPIDRWYVIRAEQFEKALRGQDIANCTPDDVTTHLTALGQEGRLEDWQFRQVVAALELLLRRTLALPWADGFDWGFWHDSAKSLTPNHPSVARGLMHEKEPKRNTPGEKPL